MKYLMFLFLGLYGSLFFSSCTPFYGLANLSSQNKYLNKPTYEDADTTATYISGQFYQGNGYESLLVKDEFNNELEDEGPLEIVTFGDIAYHRSHTWKNGNLSYGGYGFGGVYTVENVAEYQGSQSFYGAGLISDVNFNIPFEHVDWRIIGVRVSGQFEKGEYSDFRTSAVQEDEIFDIHPHDITANMSLTSEIQIKIEQVNFGFFAMTGFTTGFEGELMHTGATGLNLTYNRIGVHAQIDFMRTGFVPRITNSIGLSYRL